MMDVSLIRIEARMTLASALHIGAAGTAAMGAKEVPTARGGIDDMPYIPGSSIKGRMRALLARVELREWMPHAGDPLVALFGTHGVRGALSFWDCPLDADWLTDRQAALQAVTQVRCDLQDGGRVRTREVVPAGAPFVFRLGLSMRRADGLDTVLAGLRMLEWEGLGAGTSRGMGRVRFTALRVDGQSAQERLDRIGAD